MPINKHKILLVESGLDSDVSSRFKPMGDSDEILNDIISFVDGKVGARTNKKGNEIIYTAANGCSFIGKVQDVKRQSVIIFVHKDDGNHSIISLNTKDNTVLDIITENSHLNFSLDHPILSANVVGDLLFWTDGQPEPKSINIETAINGGYHTIDDNVINAAIKPPLCPPILQLVRLMEENVTANTSSDYYIARNLIMFLGETVNVGVFRTATFDNSLGHVDYVESTISFDVTNSTTGVLIEHFENTKRIYDNSSEITITNSIGAYFKPESSFHLIDIVTSVLAYRSDDSVVGNLLAPINGQTRYVFTAQRKSGVQASGDEMGYIDTDEIRYNNCKEKQFQFCYRYIYDDKEKSLFSPFSQCLIPTSEEELIGGFTAADQNINNAIDFMIETGGERVDKIEIAVKAGELGVWKSYDILEKTDDLIPDSSRIKYRFLNNRTFVALDEGDVLDSNNIFPQIAETQEYLPSNQLAYGRVTEGFDNIKTDIALNAIGEQISYNPAFVRFETEITEEQQFDRNKWAFLVLNLPSIAEYRDKIYVINVELPNGTDITIQGPDDWSTITGTDLEQQNELQSQLVQKLIDLGMQGKIFESGGEYTEYTYDIDEGGNLHMEKSTGLEIFYNTKDNSQIAFPYSMNYNALDDDGGDIIYGIVNVSGGVLDTSIASDPKRRTFKTGLYKVAIEYADNYGRKSSLQTGNDTQIYLDEDEHGVLIAPVIHIGYELKHKPPLWATKYQMYVTKNLSQSRSFQWTVDNAVEDVRSGIKYGIVGINRSILGTIEQIPKSSLQPYVFTDGDHVKAIGRYLDSSPEGERWRQRTDENQYEILGLEYDDPEKVKRYEYSDGDGEWVDVEIDLTDSNGKTIYKDNSQKLIVAIPQDITDIQSLFAAGDVIEIITPVKENEEDFYFGVGDCYDIINPGTENRVHQGQTTDQDPNDISGQPAIGVITEGDFTRRSRYNLTSLTDFPCIDMNTSDFFDSKMTSHGRVGVENRDSENKVYNLIRHSGKYFDNTDINDLNRFKNADKINLDDRFGEITSITQIGDTLKVYQPRKVTPVYIGKTFTQLSNGENQLVAIDRTFGVADPSKLDYGCSNPESVLRNERHIYFFDIYSGMMIRDSANGLHPVSDYKYAGFFHNKAKALLKSGLDNIKVLTGYDDENDIVVITFIDDVNPDNNETIAFHEKQNRFACNLSLMPDFMCRFGNQFYTSKGNELYVENSANVPRCQFYGVKYPRRFRVYVNIDPTMVKTFYSMSIFTNKNGWSAPNINIDPTATYPSGMLSRLKQGKFKYKEGVGYTEFMRNMITKNNVEKPILLMNGDQLRGEVMSILLEESNDEETNLYEVDINFTI